MEPIGESAFITFTGPPQKGKREHISRVRSHITRAYFERRKQPLTVSHTQQHEAQSGIEVSSLSADSEPVNTVLVSNILPEIKFAVLSVDHPMRDSSFFAAETTRRMHKCKCCLTFLVRAIA
jgi:hypothetical protein